MTPRSTIARGLDRIEAIADLYQCEYEEDQLAFATDLMSDLAHWCEANCIDYDRAAASARIHFLEEQGRGSGKAMTAAIARSLKLAEQRKAPESD